MIKDICIVGGGTAGFMTAAVLSKLDVNVKCIYSSKIGIIGVGESTQTAINDIFSFLGLADKDWMAKCNATYKTSVAFESWNTPGDMFYYPFQKIQTDEDNISNFLELCALFPDEMDGTQFARFVSPASRYGELNTLEYNGWDFDLDTAYHFDSHLLSKVLYDVAQKNGVEFIDDTYVMSHHNSNGIEKITCEKTGEHCADLFVDCTGFKSLLLGKEMKVPFKDYKTMINHRAITAKVPYKNKEEQLKNYTNNIAMNNGWCWEIPLWDGMSLGYVHSLKFATEEEISEEFNKFVLEKYGVKPETRITSFRPGRYERAWEKNVVSIGLAYGFIEPLEATGLYSVVQNIFRLLEAISKSPRINQFDRQMYNHTVNLELDKQQGFVDIHYTSAHRDDTEYWQHVTNDVEYDWDGVNQKHAINMTAVDRNYGNNYHGGIAYILAGNGYLPISPGFVRGLIPAIDMKNMATYKNNWLEADKKMCDATSKLPSTHQFLLNNIYS